MSVTASAMQPVCSLRLQSIKFKQAGQSCKRTISRQIVHSSSQHGCRNRVQSMSRHAKPLRQSTVCSDAAVPHIPFPGDNQSGAIFRALESSHDEDVSSSSDSEDLHASFSANGGPPEGKQPRIPHRWRVVGMMALAFVLCNMDKVSRCVLLH